MMGELKRKNEELTTADLANRTEQKPGVEAIRRSDEWNTRDVQQRAEGREAMRDETRDEIRNETKDGPTLIKSETSERKPKGAPVAGTLAITSTPLFSESDVNDLRGRWSNVQSDFVDQPRRAVEQADTLVATVMQRLADGFANERSGLEKQWAQGGDVSTEDLRVALQRYRSFFDRLLNA